MTRILTIKHNYDKYQNILPEEFSATILEDLKKSKTDIEVIIAEDKKIVENLLRKNRLTILFDDRNIDEIVKYSLSLKNEEIDNVNFQYAH